MNTQIAPNWIKIRFAKPATWILQSFQEILIHFPASCVLTGEALNQVTTLG
ncbi:MAG: hypothetical protein VKK04_20035 [Synechococcales bacterium]|nr:hypothetical protein [Synechococcales bacterium]